MKKIRKIFILMLIAIICISNLAYGFNIKDLNGKDGETNAIKKVGFEILSIVSIIASGLSIIVMIILGIKYMAGSVEEKAEYKKTLLPYLIGAVFVFGATSIPHMIYKMFN